jgi:hypothetical protein
VDFPSPLEFADLKPILEHPSDTAFTHRLTELRPQHLAKSGKVSIQELFNKAGVRTRSQLVRVAIERFSSRMAPGVELGSTSLPTTNSISYQEPICRY